MYIKIKTNRYKHATKKYVEKNSEKCLPNDKNNNNNHDDGGAITTRLYTTIQYYVMNITAKTDERIFSHSHINSR